MSCDTLLLGNCGVLREYLVGNYQQLHADKIVTKVAVLQLRTDRCVLRWCLCQNGGNTNVTDVLRRWLLGNCNMTTVHCDSTWLATTR